MSEDRIIRVGIAGVRGYKGAETARLIARHPRFRVAMVSSDAMAGHRLRDLDRDLVRDGDVPAVGYGDTLSAARDYGVELMFLATEPESCARLAAPLVSAGVRVIDLSGAHALRDADAHAETYGFPQPPLAAEARFGVTELAAATDLAAARVVANPGAFGTAVMLALAPIARAGLIEPGSVIVDAKGGSSTSGRKARISLLFSEVSADCRATRIERHPYAPEIQQHLSLELERSGAAPSPFALTMTTHLIPVVRGVLATSYLSISGASDGREALLKVRAALEGAYVGRPFIRLVERAEDVSLRAAVGTNRAIIGVTVDPAGTRVVVVSALDNLVKGTAGQAVQNANLMFGFDETTGLALGTGGAP
jgi:N-acetyl-gamma-glutamyl-phosphate reductase